MKKTPTPRKSQRKPLSGWARGLFFRSRVPLQGRQTNWADLPHLLDIRQTAGLLDVHPNTLRAWDQRGTFRAIRIGSRQDRRYTKESVRDVCERRRAASAAQDTTVSTVGTRRSKFVPTFVTVASILAAVILFARPTVHADVTTNREYRLRPQSCEGWQHAENATFIQLPPVAVGSDFSRSNAALFHADGQAITTNGQHDGVVTGTLDQRTDTTITCAHFIADGLPSSGELVDAKITLSFMAVTAQNSTDVFVVEGSSNGRDWFPLATFPNREQQDPYTILALNQLVDVTQFADLAIRIRADAASYNAATRAALDGVEIVTTIARPTSEAQQTRSSMKSHKQLDALVSFSQDLYQSSEQPVMTVPKKRTKQFLFLSRGEEHWTFQRVTLTDIHGATVKADYHTQDTVSGQTTNTTVTLNTATLHPGRYTVAVTMDSPAGTTETIKKDFVWGVLAMNVTKAVPQPNDIQQVDIGVLDDGGRTLCNADITLTVTDPHGKNTKYTTRDTSMKSSGACVDKGVTNIPDYSVKFSVGGAGVYHLHLQAKTAFGVRETEQNFSVDAADAFIVHRVDFPTRINPTSSYPARIAVVPLRDYTGIVSERVPTNIAVSAFQPDATVRASVDNPDEQVIEWSVEWQAGHTYFLGYTFDTPDVSPALFTVGPLLIGGSFAEDPLFREPRQWQLASDSITSQQQATPMADRKKEKDRFTALSSFEKVQYRAGEKPVLRVPKERKRQGLLSQSADVWSVKSVEVRNPSGTVTTATAHILDVPAGTDTDSTITIDAKAFHPGKNTVTVDVVMPDGSQQSIEKEVLWGVVAVNVRRSVQLPNASGDLQIAVLDDYGSTVCDSDIDVTISGPDGRQQQFSTSTGTVSRNSTCAEHSVTNEPDYSAHYVTTTAGTYQVHVHASTQDGARDVDDTFAVQDAVPFDVERTLFPTRTYPPASYPVSFAITPQQDFVGTVVETLPSSFTITNPSNSGAVVKTDTATETISWSVEWKKDQTFTLGYTFQGPPISPMLFTLGPLTFIDGGGTVLFQESRLWQIASDATRTWDGGGGADTNWSTATNWSNDTIPGASDDVVFASASSNNNSTWDTGVNSPTTVLSITSTSSYSGTLTMNQTTSTVSGAFNWAAGGLTIASTNTLSVGGNFTLTTSGTFTPNSSTVTMTGTSNSFDSGKTFYKLTIDPSSTGTITSSSASYATGPTVSNTLTVAADDTYTITGDPSSFYAVLQSGATLTLDGTISGTGGMLYQNSTTAFPTTGTVSCYLIFNASAGNLTIPGRTYGGVVRFRTPSTTARTFTLGSATGQTLNFSSDFVVAADSTAGANVTAVTNFPTVNVTGDVLFLGVATSTGAETLRLGKGTWTVSGNFKPTNVSDADGSLVVTALNTLILNGTNKTFLTTGGATFVNLTIGGSITSETSNPYNISTNLTINNGATLTMDTVRLQLNSTVTTISISGELDSTNGGSILTQTATSIGTGGTINADVVFCPLVGITMPVPARTFSGADKTITLDACSTSGSATTQIATGTFTVAGALALNASFGASGPAVADFDTYDPVVAITGNVSVSTGSTTLSMGTGGWTVGGNFNLTNIGTFNNNSGALTMNGTTKVLTSNSQSLYDFTVSGGSVSTADAATISHNLSVSGGTFTMGNAALTVTGTTSVTGTINTATGSTGTRTFTGNVTINSGGTWDLTGQNPATSFAGDITVSSGATLFNNGTGGATWTASKQLAGAVNMTFGGTNTIGAGLTLTNNNTGTVQFATINGGDANATLALSTNTANSYTKVTAAPMATGKILPSATNANTFEYGYATATVLPPTTNNYYHLILSGTGTVTMTSISGTTGNLTLSGSNTVTTSTSTFVVGGILTVGTGTTFHMGDVANTVTGATSVTGTLDTATGATGTRTFTGNVTINSGGTWDLTGQNPATSFAGDITVSSGATLFNNGTGGATWTASKQLAGAVNMTFGGTNTIGAGLTLTNNNTGTVQFATVAGGDATSSLTTGASSVTKVSGAAMTTGTIVPSTSSNIFEYNGAGQTVKAPTTNPYYNLNLSGSGSVSMPASGLTAISGTLAISGTASVTTGSTLTITGNATVATGSTFTINHDVTVNGGNLTNAGTGIITTTANTPLVTIAGTGNIGGVSGSTTFYNLTLSGTPTLTSNIQVNNNLTLPASVTAGSTTITMAGTSGTLVGGGSTIYALTINPSSAGTIALNTSDLTVSNTLTVALDDALTLNANRTLTLSANTGTSLSLSGTINGPGRLTYQNSATTFPTGGTLAATLITRFDTVNGNMNIPARTDYGAIEAYGGSANARTITLGTAAGGQTITTSSYLYVIADATGAGNNVTLQGATYDPTLNVGTDFDFTGSQAATEIVTAPDATATWTVGGNVNLTDGTWTAGAETLVMNGSSKTLTSAGNTLFNVTLSGTITLANATHTISGDLNMAGGTITAGTSTVAISGSGKTITGGSNTLYNLTLDGNGTTTLLTSGLTVSNTLNVTASDTFTLSAALTSSSTGTVTLGNSATLGGSSTLAVLNSNLSNNNSATLSAPVTFDATDLGTLTVPNRAFGGNVTLTSGSYGSVTTFTFGSATLQTLTFSGNLTLQDAANVGTVLDAASYNPTVNVTGNVTATAGGSPVFTIDMGSGTWTVTGNFSLTNVTTFNNNSGTLVMNGASKTLTSNAKTLNNVTLSGSIILANATHTVAGNLDLTGGTITAGSSTVTMTGTSKTIDGGGATLNNLTISGTETLQNTDVTVSSTLTVDNLKSLTLSANRTLTLSANTGTSLSLSGTINGPGRLTYQNSATTFPTGGTLAATLITRFDTVNGNMVIPARTDYGAIEAFGDSANARTVILGTVGSQTITTSGYFYVIADATGAGNNVTLQGATYDPTLNVGTDFDFTGSQAATEIVTAPDATATWTVGGNVNLTDGTWTAGAETLTMNGTAKLLTTGGNSLKHVTISGGTVTMVGSTTVTGNLTISGGTLSAPSSGALNVAGDWNNSGGTFDDNSSTVTFNGLSQQTAQGTMTGTSDFNHLTITNSSGTDPDTSPSVIFSSAATTAGTFTAATASMKIRFNASATYTFQNISFNGQATDTRVALRSSSGGTAWNLNVAGTRSVSYTDVKDSNACGQAPDIDASDGTNKDSGSNPCWAIAYLTVSLSPSDTVSLGTLDTTNVNQASMTSTVTTTAANGYVSTVYYDATLTSGLNTIPNADGTIAPGQSKFGASTDDATSVDLATTSNSCATGTGTYNATALSTTAKTFASESAPATSKVATLCFSAGISVTQAPGSYTSTMTLVTTGKY